MKNNENPDVDGITTEMFKHGGSELILNIMALTGKTWRPEGIQKEWRLYSVQFLSKAIKRFVLIKKV